MADDVPFPVSDYDTLSPNYAKPHRATFADKVQAAIHGSHIYGSLDFLRNFAGKVDAAAITDPMGGPTAANVSTKMFRGTRTLAGSANETLDLAGVLTGTDGQVLNLTKVHGLYVKAATGNTTNVVVGGATSNAFKGPFGDATDVIAVTPGDEFVCTSVSGWAVTAGTADLLKVTNSGATPVTYDIVLIGE